MGHGIIKGFYHLPAQGTTTLVGNGAGNHQRQIDLMLGFKIFHRRNGRLGIQGIENSLDQNNVGTTIIKPFYGFAVIFKQLVKGNCPVTRILDIG